MNIFHSVKQGETLSQIARDYRTSLSTIISANPSINPNIIYVGQQINIPGFPDPNSLPYRINISISARILQLFKIMYYKKHTQLQLVECCLIHL